MKKSVYLILLVAVLFAWALTSCVTPPPKGREVVPPTPRVAEELKVTMVSPYGKVEEQSELDTITVAFNQPMAPLTTVPKDESTGPLQFQPPIPGKYRWLGTATLAFTPAEPLPPGNIIKGSVPRGTKALSGSELKDEYTWTFETLRPILKESIPGDGRQWVSLKSSMYLRFNEPMAPDTAASFIRLSYTDKKGKRADVPIKVIAAPASEPLFLKQWKDIKPGNVLKVVPASPLEPGTRYQLVIQPGLKAQAGELGTEKKRVISFSTQNIFSFYKSAVKAKLNPEDSLELCFSNPVYLKDLVKNIRISPDVKIPDYYDEYDYDTETPNLYLNLAARTSYRVTISAGMKDIFDNRLGREVSFSFRTTDFDPFFFMAEDNGVVESNSKRLLPACFMNLDKVRVQMGKVDSGEVIDFLRGAAFVYDQSYNPGGDFYTVDRNWNPRVPRNERKYLPIKLDEVLKGSTTGLVFVQVDTLQKRQYQSRFSKAFVQVTNLGVTGKFSPENNLIWVTTLDKAEPVAGATVEIRDDANRLLWSGKTNEKGVADTPGWYELGLRKSDEWSVPNVWVFARKGGDVAFINSTWSWGISPWAFTIDTSWNQVEREFAADLFTERGLYRRGDDVHIKGIFREKKRGRWIISPVKTVNLRMYNSRDEQLFKGNVSLSMYGAFHKTIKIDPGAPTGEYRIELCYGRPGGEPVQLVSKTFLVEDFRPADFKVTVDSKKKSYVFQDTFEGNIKGAYLFGAPMTGDPVSWKFRLSPCDFQPEGYDDYDFGTMHEYDSDMEEETVSLLGTGEGKLNDRGQIDISVPLKAENVQGTMTLTVEASVKAADRTELSGSGEYVVHKGDYYIGLKPGSSFIGAKEHQKIQIIAVTPDGKKRSGESINIEIYRRTWDSVRRVTPYGREWVTEKKDEQVKKQVVRSTSNPVTIDFSPDRAGYYVIKAFGVDRRQNKVLSEAGFYASGTDYVAWPRSEDNVIELIKDKNEYKPGDKARIIVKSPYENATALVTWEREYIISSKVVPVKGSADVVVCPIEKGDMPNVFVSVVLIQGRVAEEKFSEFGEDLAKPSFKIGYVNLPIVSEEKKLTVTVNTDKSRYKPQDEVKVTLSLKDNTGKPVTGEIALAAVDEGVLSLIDYKTPNYYSAFFGPRSLVVRNAESRLHVIGQRDYGEKGENRGGGGGLDLSSVLLRTDFKSTAYWNPSIITNKRGEAEVRFKLPDNLTTFRLMAVAQTSNASFGSGEKGIVVAKPLLLKDACPRFARLNDSFQGGIMVFNGTEQRGRVTVNLESKGLTVEGQNTKMVTLDPGEEKEVLFSFKADAPGTGVLSFRAAMDSETDGLQVKIPVKVPQFTEDTATSGIIEDKTVKEKVSLPVDIVPSVGGLYVNTSSTAMVDLKGGVDYLVRYPYECLEQKLSKILPAIMAQDLVETFNLSANLRGKEYTDFIQGYLDFLVKYQKPSGGFGLWEDSQYENEYLSCYALYTMAMAKQAGYKIDGRTVEKGLVYIRTLLSRSDKNAWYIPYFQSGMLTIKSFALYDLYLWGKGDASYLSLLYEKRDEMTLFGQALLLKTLHIEGKNRDKEEELIRSFRNKLKLTPTSAHFEEAQDEKLAWIYYSNVRTTALILQAFIEVGAEFPDSHKVVKWLISAQKMGRWSNTQDNVYCFDALRTYFHKFEKEEPDCTCRVQLAGKDIMQELFKGRELTVREKNVPMSGLTPGREIEAKLSRKGKGRLYYTMRLTYAPAGGVEAKDEGIAVLKTIEPVEQAPSAENVFKAGVAYKVTLSVVTPQERTFVVVDDPLPGGFVVVNTDFSAESAELARKLARMRSHETLGKWGATFNHFETYDDRVLLFADVLGAGEHRFTYFVRAQYYGTYAIPPTKAEMMYEPEVFGFSEKRTIEVK